MYAGDKILTILQNDTAINPLFDRKSLFHSLLAPAEPANLQKTIIPDHCHTVFTSNFFFLSYI